MNQGDKTIIRPKHKEVLKKMVENVGLSRTEAMKELGYSEHYAENGNIVKTDSWEELMKNYIPDSLLAERHMELLNKREVFKVFNHTTGEYEKELADTPDTNAVKAGLDMGYKLKGKYAAEKHTLIIPVPLLGGDSRKHENTSNREITEVK